MMARSKKQPPPDGAGGGLDDDLVRKKATDHLGGFALGVKLHDQGATAKVQRWATKIGQAWDGAREAFFAAGRLLIEAKADCDHGEWLTLVGEKQAHGLLPFGSRTAQCLMQIVKCPKFQNTKTFSLLPNSWAACHDLARLADKKPEVFTAAVKAGVVRADARYVDVKHWLKKQSREAKHKQIAEKARLVAVEDRVFSLLYADPPWRFDTYSEKGKDGASPENHYPTLSYEKIESYLKDQKIEAHKSAVLVPVVHRCECSRRRTRSWSPGASPTRRK